MTENNDFKFDVVIGNPPYQDESIGGSTSAPPIYDKFMDAAFTVGKQVELITPARFLFDAGNTPKKWNRKMLNDKHLKVVDFQQNSAEVFPGTDIKGGVAVTYRDSGKDFGAIKTFFRFPELQTILAKVKRNSHESLSSIISGRGIYRLTEIALKEHPEIEKNQSTGHKTDVGTSAFKLFKDVLFFTNKPDEVNEYVQVLGILDSKRRYFWIKSQYLSTPDNFNNYKVVLAKANGAGTFGEILSTPVIARPSVGYTETFLSVGSFPNLIEAEAVKKYICSKFTRSLLGIMKITQDTTTEKWSKVPSQDFSTSSDIDWTKPIADIDQQLYKKYGLDQHEIDFIESHVKEMA